MKKNNEPLTGVWKKSGFCGIMEKLLTSCVREFSEASLQIQ
ncbi:hypothetical protein [Pedobacter arcticus]|nr:hypothetical protein [Pedobacter arcticus]